MPATTFRAGGCSPTAPSACSTGSGWTRTGASGPAPGTASIAIDPDGTLIGKVLVPEVVANCVFGGAKRNVLYICGTTSLYAVRLMVNGAKTY